MDSKSPPRKGSTPKKKKKGAQVLVGNQTVSAFEPAQRKFSMPISQQDLFKKNMEMQVKAQLNNQLDEYLKQTGAPVAKKNTPWSNRKNFNKSTKCLKQLVWCELIATIIFFICLYTLQVSELWSQKYVDSVVSDWSRNPIEEVVDVEASKTCPDGFTLIGKAHFWKINDGCYCESKNKLTVGVCTDDDQKLGCIYIKSSDHDWLPVVNGKKYCAKQISELNLLKMQRPVKKTEKEKYSCKESTYKICGDPKPDTPASKVFCIPEWFKCPITEIKFDNSGKISGKTDAALGTPIINLQLSQNGPPCIYNNDSFNNIGKTKAQYELFQPDYYNKGCEEISFYIPTLSSLSSKDQSPHMEKFTVSPTYKEVKTFKGTNEYQLLSDNMPAVLKDMKKVKSYDTAELKKYEFKMYEKRYREWEADKCFYEEKVSSSQATQKIPITPQSLQFAVLEADYLIEFSFGMLVVTGLVIILIVIELNMLSKFAKEDIQKSTLDYFVIVRRMLSLGVFVVWAIGCYLIFNFNGALFTALVKNGCANDPVLVATFKSMVAYLEGTHNQNKQIIMATFTTFLGLTCLISMIYKTSVVNKAYVKIPNFGVENKKKKQLKQALLGNKKDRDMFALTEQERKLINV